MSELPSHPLVSIVTPTFNQGAFIERTIRSVKEQRYPNIEHIIIDAGSTDETHDVIRRYEGTYNMRWLSERDNGMYDGINKGLAMTKGSIRAYLNSDDWYLPWTLETVVDEFSRHPEAGFVFGELAWIDESTAQGAVWLTHPMNLGMFRRSGIIGQPSVFWRSSVMERLGPFDSTLKYIADCDYWMRGAAAFEFRHVDEILSVESHHAATKNSSQGQALHAELRRVRQRYVSLDGPFARVQYLADKLRRYAYSESAYLRFSAEWALWRHAARQPRSWQHFITESPFEVSGGKLLKAVLGVRKQSKFAGAIRVPSAFRHEGRHDYPIHRLEAA